jgi:hypothetical protein
MLLSPADFGLLGLGRILSDRIGSKSTHNVSVVFKGRLPRRPFCFSGAGIPIGEYFLQPQHSSFPIGTYSLYLISYWEILALVASLS